MNILNDKDFRLNIAGDLVSVFAEEYGRLTISTESDCYKERIRARVLATRQAQGLPPTVEDAPALDRIAQVVRVSISKPE